MKKLIVLITAVTMLLMSAIAFAETDISNGNVVAEGVAAPGQLAPNGYRAAKLDAMRNLLEEIGSIRIDSATVVQDAVIKSDVITTKINGLVKGAKVIDKYQDAQGYFHVVVELPVYGGKSSLAAAVLPVKERVNFPEPEKFRTAAPVPAMPTAPSVSEITPPAVTPAAPSYPPTVSAPSVPSVTPPSAPPVAAPQPAPSYTRTPVASGTYTGVIIDCQGLGLQPAMAPAVFTANRQVVYGAEHFSHDEIIAKGYVSYAKNFASGVERAGNNPLIVKASSVEGGCSPVISEADAELILSENKLTGFLNNANVVFVR
ncbi:MAG: LPP20 family lipoprotein [Anaerovibrio sp.]|uniref:LPP20 family lipoprotein n=1 Tax=Anaerovibrio sp. TaxID=1872532 RepID=UPI0025F7E01C|nr:LPP20 family lipoprotein [Anaerovibrio sp.]MCR5175804.1 LPP20 family lipoprotein [Anaerovibrio sp.]